MSVSTIHTIGQIVVPGSSTFTLNGVNQFSIDPAIATVLATGGGYVDPSWVAIMSADATITATVTELAVAMAKFGISGFAIPQTTVYTSMDFYLAQMAQQGTRAGSSSHRRVRTLDALVVPRTLTLTHGAQATLTIEVFPIYDGTNNPIAAAATVSLPSTAVIAEQFTLGPTKINSSTISGVSSVTLDFGLQVTRIATDGQVFPTFVTIAERKPMYKVRTNDLANMATFLDGVVLTNITVYAQKMSEGGSRVAAGTAQHCSFISTEGIVTAQPVGGSNNTVAEIELSVPVTYDGTNAIVQVSTATAIT